MMRPFRVHRGRVAPLFRRDIDTDQIIPKQFLKSILRTGFGEHLFHDWRRQADGTLDPSFPLNDPRYAGASILVTGDNVGCGSSREHAAWALTDAGFRVVIAPSFAGIFRANAVTNGLVPVVVTTATAAEIAARAARIDAYAVVVDLDECRLRDDHALDEPFDIDEAARHRLRHGLDDIGLILQHEDAIARYEAAHPSPFARPASG
jgi:3-isopropylmalate/(R)-2-methylmalate dehydratase small subunit